MDSRKIVLKETSIVAVGEVLGIALMLGIYALLHRFSGRVAYSAALGGVLALLKTGLCGASEEALSALENYVYTWRPSAEEWRAPFTRNPAGMDAGEPGEAENEQLALAEELRARTVPVIEQFRARRGKTGRELSAALYWLDWKIRAGAAKLFCPA